MKLLQINSFTAGALMLAMTLSACLLVVTVPGIAIAATDAQLAAPLMLNLAVPLALPLMAPGTDFFPGKISWTRLSTPIQNQKKPFLNQLNMP